MPKAEDKNSGNIKIISIMLTIFTFVGGGTIAGFKANTNDHTKIKETMIERDEKLLENIHKFDVRQEVLIKTVERIEKKL